MLKALVKRSNKDDVSSRTSKKTIETAASTATNSDYVVVDASNGGGVAVDEEFTDKLLLRLRREALQVAE